MPDLADRLKTHIYHRQAKGATWAELLMLYDAWELALDAPPPRLVHTPAPAQTGRGTPFLGVQHKILSVCLSTPSTLKQIQHRIALRWDQRISPDHLRTEFWRLTQNDYLTRTAPGKYALTPVGQACLDVLTEYE